jgi:[acyl-carrier-protein] S-malonyltransferase
MKSSAEEMAVDLAKARFGSSEIPVYSNVTTQPGEDWASLLQRQLESPVRWTESVQQMIADGVTTFVECGSGEVLTGLVRRIDKEKTGLRVLDTATLSETVNKLKEQMA